MKKDAADVIQAGVRNAGTLPRRVKELYIRFSGPPGPIAGRFIETETADGHGVGVGRWEPATEDRNGNWFLILPLHADPCDDCPCVQAERERWEGEGHGEDCRRNP